MSSAAVVIGALRVSTVKISDIIIWYPTKIIWRKLFVSDLIAIPDFAAGAMENWGLITYRMTAILYDPAVSSAKNQQWVAVVVAHELAHQVFFYSTIFVRL